LYKTETGDRREEGRGKRERWIGERKIKQTQTEKAMDALLPHSSEALRIPQHI